MARLLPLLTFLAGAAIATLEPAHRRLAALPPLARLSDALAARLYGGAPAACGNLYASGPYVAAVDLGAAPPAPVGPIRGLAHITLAGRAHGGLRGLEVWMETLAPGAGTPIHSHDCEEVFFVISGTGTMRTLLPGGEVRAQALRPNSTVAVLPRVRHQLRNEGAADVQVIVAMDAAPMVPYAYASWEAAAAGKLLYPLPWDADCGAAARAAAAAGRGGEL